MSVPVSPSTFSVSFLLFHSGLKSLCVRVFSSYGALLVSEAWMCFMGSCLGFFFRLLWSIPLLGHHCLCTGVFIVWTSISIRSSFASPFAFSISFLLSHSGVAGLCVRVLSPYGALLVSEAWLCFIGSFLRVFFPLQLTPQVRLHCLSLHHFVSLSASCLCLQVHLHFLSFSYSLTQAWQACVLGCVLPMVHSLFQRLGSAP